MIGAASKAVDFFCGQSATTFGRGVAQQEWEINGVIE